MRHIWRFGMISITIVLTYATGVCPLELSTWILFTGLTVLTPCMMRASDFRRPSPRSKVIGIKFVSSRRETWFRLPLGRANQTCEKISSYRRSMPPRRA